jgi:hypothetical protein
MALKWLKLPQILQRKKGIKLDHWHKNDCPNFLTFWMDSTPEGTESSFHPYILYAIFTYLSSKHFSKLSVSNCNIVGDKKTHILILDTAKFRLPYEQ